MEQGSKILANRLRSSPDCRESAVSAPLTTHDKFLKRAETFDLLIAVKLHAAVLASAANVPCVVLEYQPKCLDFAASIGWERFTIRTSHLTLQN